MPSTEPPRSRNLAMPQRFIADGAYDGGPKTEAIKAAVGPDVELIIPPPKNAVRGDCPTRNAHIDMIKKRGRIAWPIATRYGQRSRVEAQIRRHKQVIGATLCGRKMETQTTEAALAIKALNRMTRLGRAVYQRVA